MLIDSWCSVYFVHQFGGFCCFVLNVFASLVWCLHGPLFVVVVVLVIVYVVMVVELIV